MHWSKPREIRARLVEASRESRETKAMLRESRARLGDASRESRETSLAKSRDAREMWRKYTTMHRKLAGSKTKVCCRDVKVAVSSVYDVRERIISSFL